MESIDVQVKRLRQDAVLPEYMTDLAAGMDLCAALEAPLHLSPGQRHLVPTGIALGIPAGFEGQVRPRSGLALRKGLTLLNSPGTIDADYRGEIGVIVINLGDEGVTIEPGDRIAQLVVAPVRRAVLVPVDGLDETARSVNGFGHTGTGLRR